MKKHIAERNLLYRLKETEDIKRCAIRIGAPYLLEQEKAGFSFDEGAAGCLIEFEGLPESSINVHGIDLLHALILAVDVDSYLKGMLKKYDFYWGTGEPYFENEDLNVR